MAWPARNLSGYGQHTPQPNWPSDSKICVSFCLNYEEGAEYSTTHGDAHSESYLSEISPRVPKSARDPGIESEFDYGARAGVWRLLRLFEAMEMRCTVWGVGLALESNKEVGRQMHRAGHEIAGHGWRWFDYAEIGAVEEATHVRSLLNMISEVTGGVPPVGHYVGRHSLATLDILEKVHRERGAPLLYSSDTYGDDLPYWVSRPKAGEEDRGMLMIPYSLDNNDVKFGLANGFGSPDGLFISSILDEGEGLINERYALELFTHLKNAFDYLYEEGCAGSPKMMSIGLHARISGRPARAFALRKFMRYIKEKEGVWIATRREIAEHWRKEFPYLAGAGNEK